MRRFALMTLAVIIFGLGFASSTTPALADPASALADPGGLGLIKFNVRSTTQTDANGTVKTVSADYKSCRFPQLGTFSTTRVERTSPAGQVTRSATISFGGYQFPIFYSWAILIENSAEFSRFGRCPS